jgi:hypothetical protein
VAPFSGFPTSATQYQPRYFFAGIAVLIALAARNGNALDVTASAIFRVLFYLIP